MALQSNDELVTTSFCLILEAFPLISLQKLPFTYTIKSLDCAVESIGGNAGGSVGGSVGTVLLLPSETTTTLDENFRLPVDF